jgi:L-alanine-DL-glutamate epimerase-like enolase superfamily enzyme
MRINRFETFLCTYTFPEEETFWGGRWDMDFRGVRFNAVLLRVHTDEGISGLGEATSWGDCPGMAARIHSLEPRFLGRDPFDVEKLTVLGADGETNRALAAIDVALWDIVGKATGTPVFRLLARDGDVQPNNIRTYASGGVGYAWFDRPEQVVDEVLRHKANGFTAFKMRIGSAWGLEGVTMDRFGQLLHVVRDAMGEDMDLMLDANSRFRSVDEAIEVARMLDDVGARWFEDPVNHHGEDGPERIVAIQERVKVPISGGETYHNLEQHQRFIQARAFALVHVDSTFVGLTHAYQLARLYHDLGLPCLPHSWTNAIAQAANAHLVAAIPNRVMLETQQIGNPMLTELVDNPIPVNQGTIDVPERPGLGIELDEEAVKRYPFTENGIFVPWPR